MDARVGSDIPLVVMYGVLMKTAYVHRRSTRWPPGDHRHVWEAPNIAGVGHTPRCRSGAPTASTLPLFGVHVLLWSTCAERRLGGPARSDTSDGATARTGAME